MKKERRPGMPFADSSIAKLLDAIDHRNPAPTVEIASRVDAILAKSPAYRQTKAIFWLQPASVPLFDRDTHHRQ